MTQGVDRPDTITIPRSEYDLLVRAEQKLDDLEALCIEKWEGYADAMAALPKAEPAADVATESESEPTSPPEPVNETAPDQVPS